MITNESLLLHQFSPKRLAIDFMTGSPLTGSLHGKKMKMSLVGQSGFIFQLRRLPYHHQMGIRDLRKLVLQTNCLQPFLVDCR